MNQLLIILFSTIYSFVSIPQEGFVVSAHFINPDKIEINLHKETINGPVRLKLNQSIKEVELIQAQGGTLIKDKGHWIIIWSNIPEQQEITLLMKTDLTSKTNQIGVLSYLMEGERKSQNVFFNTENQLTKINNANNKIPEKFIVLDTDKNNFISTLEINQAVNGFFDQTNNLTVADLTKLIDYFFEQE